MKYYRIFKFQGSHGYNHIRIEVNNPNWRSDDTFAFQWQESESDPGQLYAGRFRIESAAPKQVAAFIRAFPIHFYSDFTGVIEQLEKKGYILAEYSDSYKDHAGYTHCGLVIADWIDDEGWATHRRFHAGGPSQKYESFAYLAGGCDPELPKRVKARYGEAFHGKTIHCYSQPVRTTRFQEAAELVKFYSKG